jgi:hypothetical protein
MGGKETLFDQTAGATGGALDRMQSSHKTRLLRLQGPAAFVGSLTILKDEQNSGIN